MKTTLLSFAAAFAFFVSASAATAAPAPARPGDNRRVETRYDRDFNYGYPKNHRVTAAEKARWEAQQRELQRRQAAAARNDHDPRNDRDFNYGYPKNHRVTAAERARWEAAHRYDHR